MSKDVWKDHPEIWKSKAAFFNWLRGCLRRSVWNRYPLKIEILKECLVDIPPGYVGKAKKFAKCALSGDVVPRSNCQVDHICGQASMQDWDDVVSFIQHLCADKDNLQVVSKEAHKIKSYAEKYKITFEEATDIKQAISIMRLRTDKKWLEYHNITPAKTAKQRREQIIKKLKEFRENDKQ